MALSKINTNSIATVSNVNTGNVIFTDGSTLSSGWTGFKNRIINGAMVVDQRNSGSAISVTNTSNYSLDRFCLNTNISSSKFTVQQKTDTPPAGFSHYIRYTTATAYTLTSGDYFIWEQRVEGNNLLDLDYGLSTAKTITVSFWVRCSSSGSFCFSLQSNPNGRCYLTSFTINAANTWEYKTITIPGDTVSSMSQTNTTGLFVRIGLGQGTSRVSSPTNSWTSSIYTGITGQYQVVENNGATFDLTGLQLEKGSTASSFEWRPYTTELALCQRYFVKLGLIVLPAAYYTYRSHFFGRVFPVTMRTTPSITVYSAQTNTINKISGYSTGTEYTVNELNVWNGDTISYVGTSSAISNQEPQGGTFWCSAEL